ncbi:MAG: hypothetical protein KAS73_14075, partial [Candidatus Sabulitectum sp.]|nr:hypothetical protein [Candidatus Sabulitectum sp.]
AVLGDMLELGEKSLPSHKEVLRLVEEYGFDLAILVGNWFRMASESNTGLNFILAADWREALAMVKDSAKPGSTILVKGSNSIQLGQLVQELKREGI